MYFIFQTKFMHTHTHSYIYEYTYIHMYLFTHIYFRLVIVFYRNKGRNTVRDQLILLPPHHPLQRQHRFRSPFHLLYQHLSLCPRFQQMSPVRTAAPATVGAALRGTARDTNSSQWTVSFPRAIPRFSMCIHCKYCEVNSSHLHFMDVHPAFLPLSFSKKQVIFSTL